MKHILKISLIAQILLALVFIPENVKPQNWGERVFESAPTTYEIYKKNFAYTDTTFLTTDLRSDSLAMTINSFNIQNLSVFRAYDGNDYLAKAPVIFFVHGGGWTDGYASMYDYVSVTLTGMKGWVTVNVDYRLTSDSVFIADEYCPDRYSCDSLHRTKAAWYPDNINDVAGAFKWTMENIENNGGDTSKVFIFGHSAGGHLISLFAVHPDFEDLRKHIKGAISMSGAYDIKSLNFIVFEEPVTETFTGGYFNNDTELDEASPIMYIYAGQNLPPFYLLYCQFDIPSLPQQNTDFYNAMYNLNYDVKIDYLSGYNHISEIADLAEIDSTPSIFVTQFIESRLDEINSVKDKSDENPSAFSLSQNYPNPFNPATLIEYGLSASGFVQLRIYDVLGREIKTLVNGRQTKGNYEAAFDAGNLSGGVYFYKLTFQPENSGGQYLSKVKKMLLLR